MILSLAIGAIIVVAVGFFALIGSGVVARWEQDRYWKNMDRKMEDLNKFK